MSDTAKTYTAREIVLEFFPATRNDLIPAPFPYTLTELGEGCLKLEHQQRQQYRILKPISPAGKASTLLCCDLCHHQASRRYIQLYRVDGLGKQGRKTRYLSLCRQHDTCGTRQISSQPIKAIEYLFD